MFKRLSKASAHREQVDNDEEYVPLDAALDDDSQSEDEQADSEEEEDDSDEEEEDETALTVAHAMESPIYMDDEQPESPYRFRCVACPIVLLKSEKSIDVHLESKNHKRRHARLWRLPRRKWSVKERTSCALIHVRSLICSKISGLWKQNRQDRRRPPNASATRRMCLVSSDAR